MEFTEIENKVKALFKEYEQSFNFALTGKINVEQISKFYTDEFIAVNPHGVKTGQKNTTFKENLSSGYAYYRNIGTKKMQCEKVSVIQLDNLHVIAQTKWEAIYVKNNKEIKIPFSSSYLIQFRKNRPFIFGWITGDEQQLMKENGLI
ncbi:nuclear transport factor 2 family protein [Weissella paramesenteroides]